MIEIQFPAIKCPKCDSTKQIAVQKGYRYALYCKNCGSYIKWADKGQTTIINARKAWLEEHEK